MCFFSSWCSMLTLLRPAGASIHAHLGAIFPPVLALASQRGKGDAASLAAQEVTRKVTAAVAEDGSYLLVAQVTEASYSVPRYFVKGFPAASWHC